AGKCVGRSYAGRSRSGEHGALVALEGMANLARTVGDDPARGLWMDRTVFAGPRCLDSRNRLLFRKCGSFPHHRSDGRDDVGGDDPREPRPHGATTPCRSTHRGNLSTGQRRGVIANRCSAFRDPHGPHLYNTWSIGTLLEWSVSALRVPLWAIPRPSEPR